jgi:hypothetical protein
MKNLINKKGYIKIQNKKHFKKVVKTLEQETGLKFIGVPAGDLKAKKWVERNYLNILKWREIKKVYKDEIITITWSERSISTIGKQLDSMIELGGYKEFFIN